MRFVLSSSICCCAISALSTLEHSSSNFLGIDSDSEAAVNDDQYHTAVNSNSESGSQADHDDSKQEELDRTVQVFDNQMDFDNSTSDNGPDLQNITNLMNQLNLDLKVKLANDISESNIRSSQVLAAAESTNITDSSSSSQPQIEKESSKSRSSSDSSNDTAEAAATHATNTAEDHVQNDTVPTAPMPMPEFNQSLEGPEVVNQPETQPQPQSHAFMQSQAIQGAAALSSQAFQGVSVSAQDSETGAMASPSYEILRKRLNAKWLVTKNKCSSSSCMAAFQVSERQVEMHGSASSSSSGPDNGSHQTLDNKIIDYIAFVLESTSEPVKTIMNLIHHRWCTEMNDIDLTEQQIRQSQKTGILEVIPFVSSKLSTMISSPRQTQSQTTSTTNSKTPIAITNSHLVAAVSLLLYRSFETKSYHDQKVSLRYARLLISHSQDTKDVFNQPWWPTSEEIRVGLRPVPRLDDNDNSKDNDNRISPEGTPVKIQNITEQEDSIPEPEAEFQSQSTMTMDVDEENSSNTETGPGLILGPSAPPHNQTDNHHLNHDFEILAPGYSNNVQFYDQTAQDMANEFLASAPPQASAPSAPSTYQMDVKDVVEMLRIKREEQMKNDTTGKWTFQKMFFEPWLVLETAKVGGHIGALLLEQVTGMASSSRNNRDYFDNDTSENGTQSELNYSTEQVQQEMGMAITSELPNVPECPESKLAALEIESTNDNHNDNQQIIHQSQCQDLDPTNNNTVTRSMNFSSISSVNISLPGFRLLPSKKRLVDNNIALLLFLDYSIDDYKTDVEIDLVSPKIQLNQTSVTDSSNMGENGDSTHVDVEFEIVDSMMAISDLGQEFDNDKVEGIDPMTTSSTESQSKSQSDLQASQPDEQFVLLRSQSNMSESELELIKDMNQLREGLEKLGNLTDVLDLDQQAGQKYSQPSDLQAQSKDGVAVESHPINSQLDSKHCPTQTSVSQSARFPVEHRTSEESGSESDQSQNTNTAKNKNKAEFHLLISERYRDDSWFLLIKLVKLGLVSIPDAISLGEKAVQIDAYRQAREAREREQINLLTLVRNIGNSSDNTVLAGENILQNMDPEVLLQQLFKSNTSQLSDGNQLQDHLESDFNSEQSNNIESITLKIAHRNKQIGQWQESISLSNVCIESMICAAQLARSSASRNAKWLAFVADVISGKVVKVTKKRIKTLGKLAKHLGKMSIGFLSRFYRDNNIGFHLNMIFGIKCDGLFFTDPTDIQDNLNRVLHGPNNAGLISEIERNNYNLRCQMLKDSFRSIIRKVSSEVSYQLNNTVSGANELPLRKRIMILGNRIFRSIFTGLYEASDSSQRNNTNTNRNSNLNSRYMSNYDRENVYYRPSSTNLNNNSSSFNFSNSTTVPRSNSISNTTVTNTVTDSNSSPRSNSGNHLDNVQQNSMAIPIPLTDSPRAHTTNCDNYDPDPITDDLIQLAE